MRTDKESKLTKLFAPSFLSFAYLPLNDSKTQNPAGKPVDPKDNHGTTPVAPSQPVQPAPTVPVNPVISDQGNEAQTPPTPVTDQFALAEPIVMTNPNAVQSAPQNNTQFDENDTQDVVSEKQNTT